MGHTFPTSNLSQIQMYMYVLLTDTLTPPPHPFVLHILTSGVKFSSSSELDSMCSCPRTLTTMLVMSLHTVFRRCLVRIASVSSDRKNICLLCHTICFLKKKGNMYLSKATVHTCSNHSSGTVIIDLILN